MTKLTAVNELRTNEAKQSMLDLLERTKRDVESGTILRIGIVTDRIGNEWSSAFSRSENRVEDAAKLIELGLRRLGFLTHD